MTHVSPSLCVPPLPVALTPPALNPYPPQICLEERSAGEAFVAGGCLPSCPHRFCVSVSSRR
jgi:hypothetical protein